MPSPVKEESQVCNFTQLLAVGIAMHDSVISENYVWIYSWFIESVESPNASSCYSHECFSFSSTAERWITYCDTSLVCWKVESVDVFPVRSWLQRERSPLLGSCHFRVAPVAGQIRPRHQRVTMHVAHGLLYLTSQGHLLDAVNDAQVAVRPSLKTRTLHRRFQQHWTLWLWPHSQKLWLTLYG